MVGERRVGYEVDLGVSGQPQSKLLGVVIVAVHTQGQGLDSCAYTHIYEVYIR